MSREHAVETSLQVEMTIGESQGAWLYLQEVKVFTPTCPTIVPA